MSSKKATTDQPAGEGHGGDSRRPRLLAVEKGLLILFSLLWLLDCALYGSLLSAAGALDLDLYRFYSVGAVLGWVAGNIFELRRASVPRSTLLLIYLVGPMSFVLLLRAMAPSYVQAAAPLVPFYALVVYGVFFLVPVTLRATRTARR